MGPPASISFSFLGAGLWLLGGNRARRVVSGMAIVPIGIALLSIVGHLYGASQLFAVARFTGVALQTATMLAALGVGLVAAVPEHGALALLRRDDPGGVVFRRLAVPIVLFPIVLGWLPVLGEREGFYDAAFGVAAHTLVEIVLFAALLWWTANGISRHSFAARQAEQALREADRLKDEFLATLSHELRNPLAPLRNGLEIVRRAPNDAEGITRAHSIMDRQLAQLVRLVDDLLDISRISRGRIELRKERIELRAVLENAVETSRPVFDAFGHDFVMTEPPEAIFIEGDTTRLAQVLANLLDNAAKYTPPGGRVRVRVQREDARVLVRIRDNGVGISAEVLPKLFEMFTRVASPLERSRGGLGVGLALVKRLVEMHGGDVAVYSPPAEVEGDGAPRGKGSEFVVRLPIAEPVAPNARIEPVGEPPRAHSEPPANGATAARAGRRILVADDNVDAAETVALLLENRGHAVRVVHDGKAAVEMAAAFRPHVALLDIGMPEMNGYEVARALRQQTWSDDVVLIALTGWGQAEDRKRSSEAGFDHHIVKPATPEALEQLLTNARDDKLATCSHAHSA
jgi:signal transduction histidine kinase/CheY-like chemotaxis protein